MSSIDLDLSTLTAISPIDGRYGKWGQARHDVRMATSWIGSPAAAVRVGEKVRGGIVLLRSCGLIRMQAYAQRLYDAQDFTEGWTGVGTEQRMEVVRR